MYQTTIVNVWSRRVQISLLTLVLAGFAAGALASPIEIWTIEELQKIGYDAAYPRNGVYRLMTDLDASVTATWNGNAGFKPIGVQAAPFTGSFDGQGHVVTDLSINRPGMDQVGLFGYVGGAGMVVNLAVEGGAVIGGNDVGGLVGLNSGTISHCYSDLFVSGELAAGGLVGYNEYGTISNAFAHGDVMGDIFVGGLVGDNYAGEITRSFASGETFGAYYVGGLAGINGGAVEECYAVGAVSGIGNLGGLIGHHGGGTVTASYWNKETTGRTTSSGSLESFGKTTAEMMQTATFTDWSFGVDWVLSPEFTRYFAPLRCI